MLTQAVILLCLCLIFAGGAPNYQVPYPHNGRIIGGEDADIADHPYQLSLVVKNFGHACGAILIAKNWALTAAHCTDGLVAFNFTIRAGSSLHASNGQLVDVSTIIQHNAFSFSTADSDIALLKLSSDVTVANASAIDLTSSRPEDGAIATVTGWGTTTSGENEVYPDVLQAVDVPIVSQRDCENAYAVGNNRITENMICAGLLGVGGKDACFMDSGGPLVVGGKLIGIVSWGRGCAEPYFPGVYTDVTRFRDWIKQNSGV